MHTKLNTALSETRGARAGAPSGITASLKKNPSSPTLLIISSQMRVTLAKNNY